MKTLTFASVLVLAVPLFSPAAGSQTSVYTFDGDAPGDRFAVVSGAGDVNGDGVPDLIVSARLADTVNGIDSGMARVFSGLNGATLHTFLGDAAGDQLGGRWPGSISGAGDGRYRDPVLCIPVHRFWHSQE